MSYPHYNPYSANLAGHAWLFTEFSKAVVLTIAVKVLGMLQHTNPLSLIKKLILRDFVKMPNFWGPKKDKNVINSSTKCLISVKIVILTPHIIPLPLVNVWLIFDLQIYVKWLCVFLEVNPCFQRAHVFCMDLQPAADPYNAVCKLAWCSQTWQSFHFHLF